MGLFYGLFMLGQVVSTQSAKSKVSETERISALTRHINADWGDVSRDDAAANDEAMETGERILSSYKTSDGVDFWIITDANRRRTTLLLPGE